MKSSPKPQTRSLDYEIDFLSRTKQLPPADQIRLLTWLRKWRRRPARVWWQLDEHGHQHLMD